MTFVKTAGLALSIVIYIVMVTGCSGISQTSPVTPPVTEISRMPDTSDRVLWGYYQFEVDPVAETVSILPMRHVSMHLNALKYLETPTSTLVSLESPPFFHDGTLFVEIGLTHPLAQKIYTGFDVRGILISRGSVAFDGGYLFPGMDDFRIAYPDGYTRYWNPTDFSGTGYQDGILGTPNSIGNFNATVNGFMYFADGLGSDESFHEFDNPSRGAFSSGVKNTREYEINIGNNGFIFNYAVDASWAMPENTPPVVPDDFDPEKANCKEAWRVNAEATSFITPAGGNCTIEADVYDWQGMSTIEGVYLQAPDIFTGEKPFTDPVDNGDYVTYTITFANELGGYGEYLPLMLRVEDTGASTNPYLETFLFDYVPIKDVEITLEEDEDFKTPGTDYLYSREVYDLGVVLPPLDYLSTTGPWDFTVIDFSESEHRISYGTDDPVVADFVNDFPAAVEYFFLEGDPETGIYRAESHNYPTDDLYLHGLVTNDANYGNIVFGTPGAYSYPLNNSTDFTVHKSVVIIPILLTVDIDFTVTAIGQGWARVPYDDGEWFNVLLVRNTIEMSTSGMLGEGWMTTVLAYEWTSDEGTVVAMLVANNTKDEDPNFEDGTYIIIGECHFAALQDISYF